MALGPLYALPLCLCARPWVKVWTDTRHPIVLDAKEDVRSTVVLPIVLHAIVGPHAIPFVVLSVLASPRGQLCLYP